MDQQNEFIKTPTSSELLKTIFLYINKIANERDIDRLLVYMADMGRDLITADRCTVWLVNKKNDTLWTRVAHGVDRLVIPLSKGVAGFVAETGEPVITNDAYTDPRFDKNVDKATGYKTRNILALPIYDSRGEIFGVYQAINKMTKGKRFTQKDEEHLLLAASYTGRQLESALLQEEIEETQSEIIFTLAETGEMRSKETGNHVKRVSEYCRILSEYCGFDQYESELIKKASPLHDIGKIAIPDSVLLKPGRLTDDERTVMETHADLGWEMLKYSERKLLKAAAIIARDHHEKYNGKGYPRRIKGEEIHIYARIAAIADVFDALACDRVYKKAWPIEKILNLFKEERGQHFDPKLVDVFIKNINDFVEIKSNYKYEIPD